MYDEPALDPVFLAEARAGLGASPRRMSPKWFYDTEGSRLFEAITRLPEYYPTRTETAILRAGATRLARHVPPGAVLVELGSGASVKTAILLDAIERLAAYVPVDISADFLGESAARLRRARPGLTVHPVAADFLGEIALPEALAGRPVAVFFPGSTIGNLDDAEAVALLARARRLPGAAAFILGADMVKDTDVLLAAYDDAAGVTAAFNRNLLVRMNRELGTDFDPAAFRHEARWNAAESRIEMHLVARRAMRVRLGSDNLHFAAGESIHTENSRKFTLPQIDALAAAAGWRVAETLQDAERHFSVLALT